MLDITQRKEAEEQIAFLAYHDKLTGLPNRALFDELLELRSRARGGTGSAWPCISLDIDNFKLVNDSLGPRGGRRADRAAGGAAARGDARDRPGRAPGRRRVPDAARRPRTRRSRARTPTRPRCSWPSPSPRGSRHALRQPFEVAGTELYVTASLGISLFPRHAEDAETLLKHADHAMFRSKQIGPGGSFLHAAGDVDAMGKLSLSTRLRKAVENQSWMLHYQPLIDLSTGGMIGVEALIRWPEPGGGLIQPGEFIPLAEEMGLIEAIGDWVVEEVCRQDALWRARRASTLEISFNLSPRQLWQPDVVDKIMSRLRARRGWIRRASRSRSPSRPP